MLSIEAWHEAGVTVDLLGHKIFYRDTRESDKPVLVLIHGFPTSSWDWSKMWVGLNQNFRLVAADMLGFGFSDKPLDHIYSIHEQADILEALMEKLELGKFHVLAHDYGDTVAQELLARENAKSDVDRRWLSICFLNGGLFPETHRARLIQKLLLSPIGPLVNKLSNKKVFDKNMTKVFGPSTPPSTEELKAFWQLVNYNNGRHVFHKLISYMKDRRQHRERWLDALKQCKVPKSLINGSADPVSGAHMVSRYKELVGDGIIYELPTIGHYPQVEAPEEVANNYFNFINTIS